ncbi:alpha/beta hydrolase [Nocardioides marmoraquaticus]
MDYDDPHGRTIDVAVIRHRATLPSRNSSPRKIIFWNAGGPGGAPTDALSGTLPLFASAMRNKFDVVALDPRGIGRSTPLTCFDSAEDEAALLSRLPAGFPNGAREVRRAVRTYRQYSDACARNGGPIQRHMSTANVARDMDLLRRILRQPRLNYYGPSYGTYLGATYLNLFPRRAGRIVLDGNVPPEQWNGTAADGRINTFSRIRSPRGANRGLRLFLRRCGTAGTSRCAFADNSPRATTRKYRVLLTRLDERPVTVGSFRFTFAQTASLTGSLLASQVATTASPGWRELASLLQTIWRQTRSNQPVPAEVEELLRQLAQTPSASPAGTLGVLCGESPNPSNPYAYDRQGRLAERRKPFGLGRTWTWLAQPCATWRARDADRYTGPWDRSTSPVLVIGTRADSNTAFSGSIRMARQLSHARLLTETGGGHTAMLNKSTCIDRAVNRYLLRGALPAVGTVCRQDRGPFRPESD